MQELASAPKLKTLLLDPNPLDDKKLTKVLKEGRLKNILTHIKKHGTPPSAEAEAEAAAALAILQLAAAVKRPYELLPVNKDSQLDVLVHPEVKGGRTFWQGGRKWGSAGWRQAQLNMWKQTGLISTIHEPLAVAAVALKQGAISNIN